MTQMTQMTQQTNDHNGNKVSCRILFKTETIAIIITTVNLYQWKELCLIKNYNINIRNRVFQLKIKLRILIVNNILLAFLELVSLAK